MNGNIQIIGNFFKKTMSNRPVLLCYIICRVNFPCDVSPSEGAFSRGFRPAHRTGAATGVAAAPLLPRFRGAFRPAHRTGAATGVAAAPILPRFRGAFRPAHRTGAAGGGSVSNLAALPRGFRLAHRTGAAAVGQRFIVSFFLCTFTCLLLGAIPAKVPGRSGSSVFSSIRILRLWMRVRSRCR